MATDTGLSPAFVSLDAGAHRIPQPINIHALKSTKGSWQKFVSWIWDSDYYEKSDAERYLVFKLDCALLSLLSFGFLMKYIDQTNLANAYVSGMKTDLNIQGNQYTWMNTIYNVVFCVMQIPSNLIVLKVRPSYYLAMCELGWTVFTFAQAGATSTSQMYAFRFFVAFFEAAFQPVSYFLLGSWYTKTELAKRVSIYYIASGCGQAFSGFMQAAIYTTMNGRDGLAGWRWLYIICGLITIPCGIAIFFFLPDYPQNTKVWYLTEEEKELAKERCALNGTVSIQDSLNMRTFVKAFKSWHFWLLIPTYVLYAFGIQDYNYFTIYLQDVNYPVYLRNILPACSNLIGVPFQLVWGWLSDKTGSRFVWCVLPLLWAIVPQTILAVYPAGNTIKVFAFMAGGTYFITHIYYTWINEICHANADERAFIIACTNTFFFAVNSWLPPIVFLQTDGPRFAKGFPTTLACNCASIILMFPIWYMHRRQLQRESVHQDLEDPASSQDLEKTPDEKESVDETKVAVHDVAVMNA